MYNENCMTLHTIVNSDVYSPCPGSCFSHTAQTWRYVARLYNLRKEPRKCSVADKASKLDDAFENLNERVNFTRVKLESKSIHVGRGNTMENQPWMVTCWMVFLQGWIWMVWE